MPQLRLHFLLHRLVVPRHVEDSAPLLAQVLGDGFLSVVLDHGAVLVGLPHFGERRCRRPWRAALSASAGCDLLLDRAFVIPSSRGDLPVVAREGSRGALQAPLKLGLLVGVSRRGRGVTLRARLSQVSLYGPALATRHLRGGPMAPVAFRDQGVCPSLEPRLGSVPRGALLALLKLRHAPPHPPAGVGVR